MGAWSWSPTPPRVGTPVVSAGRAYSNPCPRKPILGHSMGDIVEYYSGVGEPNQPVQTPTHASRSVQTCFGSDSGVFLTVPAEPWELRQPRLSDSPRPSRPQPILSPPRPALSALSSPLRYPPLHHAWAMGNGWHTRSHPLGRVETCPVPLTSYGRRACHRAA